MMRHILLLIISLCSVCCSEDINQEEPNNTPNNTPYDVFWIKDFAVSGNSVYAAADFDGVFRLDAGSRSWQRIGSIFFVESLAVSGTTIYAGATRIYRLDKDNDTWARISETDTPVSTTKRWGGASPVSLVASDDNIYAGMSNGRLYCSVNGGHSWNYINREWQKDGLITALLGPPISALAISDATLYAGTEGEGVFRSLDSGDSWTPVNTDLAEQNVTSLAVSGTTVYAGTRDGVFRLANDDSWTHVGLSGSSIVSLIAEPGTNGLYAGTSSNGVFHAPDGVSWQDWGLRDLPITALAVSEKYLYAGIFGNPFAEEGRAGIFRRRTDSSAHDLWTPINQGLTKIRY